MYIETMSKLKAILKWKTMEGLNNSAISEKIKLELLGISQFNYKSLKSILSLHMYF